MQYKQDNTIRYNTMQFNTNTDSNTKSNTITNTNPNTNAIRTQYNAIQYNTIQYNTIQHNTLQNNTIQYNIRRARYNTIRQDKPGQSDIRQAKAISCDTIQGKLIEDNAR